MGGAFRAAKSIGRPIQLPLVLPTRQNEGWDGFFLPLFCCCQGSIYSIKHLFLDIFLLLFVFENKRGFHATDLVYRHSRRPDDLIGLGGDSSNVSRSIPLNKQKPNRLTDRTTERRWARVLFRDGLGSHSHQLKTNGGNFRRQKRGRIKNFSRFLWEGGGVCGGRNQRGIDLAWWTMNECWLLSIDRSVLHKRHKDAKIEGRHGIWRKGLERRRAGVFNWAEWLFKTLSWLAAVEERSSRWFNLIAAWYSMYIYIPWWVFISLFL